MGGNIQNKLIFQYLKTRRCKYYTMWLAIIIINYSIVIPMGGYFQVLKVALEAKMVLWAYLFVV